MCAGVSCAWEFGVSFLAYVDLIFSIVDSHLLRL